MKNPARLPEIKKDTRLPTLPELRRGQWATLYGNEGVGVSTLAGELAVMLASQYRVVLLRAQPRKGVAISRSPGNSWLKWARKGASLPQQGNFLVTLDAPVKRVGSAVKMAYKWLPKVGQALQKALQDGRLDFVVVDGGQPRSAVWDVVGKFPRPFKVSVSPAEQALVRNRWQEGQPPGTYGNIPDLPALAAACAKQGVPMVYASGTMKKAFWQLAANLFAPR